MTLSIPEHLQKKIQQNNLVIFVGAGISMHAGLPNWNTLLEKILDGLGSKEPKAEKYKGALKDELFSAIEILGKLEYLKESAIEVFFKEMKNFEACQPTLIHNKIGEIADKILTTNYDGLLEKALPTFEKIIYTNTYKVAKLSEFEKYIFKIHGDIHEPDKCILFPSGYDNLYSNDEKSSTFELKKIISDKSILFLGFSLNDPYINYVFNYINNLYSGFNPEHFIITTQKNKAWPKKVTPIELDDFNDLENFLDQLVQIRASQKKEMEVIQQRLEEREDISIVEFTQSSEFDSPPVNKFWVGRGKEIINIGNDNFKVVFITGIGGQGKSALAAHFLRNYFNSKVYEFGDWRDFKEETNRFQTKLFSMIKRLANKDSPPILENLKSNELVDVFFHFLGERKIVFVFDNVDSYIDLETFKPTGSLGYFFENILSKNHNSKFIFTCRPFIREASVNFYQISLTGLSEEETEELFIYFKISINPTELKNLSQRAHKITKGHPLWLNLIAGQALRGIEIVNYFIQQIEKKSAFDEDNFSAILSEKILNEVWISLNDKQKTLIRGIAETVKPEREDSLKTILDSELNNNQFTKALRVLKNLNLVETLSDGEIELHPLVKEFILTKYPKNERAKFITLFVQYYDKFIYILKPKLNSNLTIGEFQNWTSKIELQINKNDFISALISLEEVSYAILTSGFTEEYLRVSEILYNTLDWNEAISKEYPYFHTQLLGFTRTQVHLGKYVDCDATLKKYLKLIPGKSSNYLSYCGMKSYTLWYQGLHEEAIAIAEEGAYLLDESSLQDSYSLRHNLALGLRDSKVEKNIKKALEHFLQNEKIEDVLNREKINFEFSGHFYGNIGKCLEYIGLSDDALFCYYVSLKLLLKEQSDTNSILNIGYASHWISQILLDNKYFKDALYFLKYSRNSYEKVSPPMAKVLEVVWANIPFDKTTKQSIERLTNWKIENHCKEHLGKALL
ncbi:SIR2 family protein [Pedobacter sp. SG908]|uniref:SIR2 family protein n=1 Tax=Pedobacter sp. SG908 TaxID=2587135 RepID=UPI00141D8E23|nr:SIR2 family protein [Pedobacter sp. SG908]NII83174.1 tetratricopeptide (TPR) repeat protein [Pedobacter sp. SG908]